MASNSSGINANLERLGYGAPSGCIATGQHREVISEAVATRTLVAEESGALCFFDLAAGVTYTLPAPVKGMQFDFSVSVTRTTNSHKIVTNAATVFLLGAYMAGDATIATSGDIFTGDGTSHVAITIDGDTKGGFVGGHLRFTALSATQWFVEGLVIGTGTMVTAFA
jgi:hypothetical protein